MKSQQNSENIIENQPKWWETPVSSSLHHLSTWSVVLEVLGSKKPIMGTD